MSKGLRDRPKVKKKASTRSKNGTMGLLGAGDITTRHENADCETTYYTAYKEYPDQALTRKEHTEFLEKNKKMRQPVNRWNRGGKSER